MTDTKLYVPVVTSSTQDNPKFFELLKAGFKRPIKCKKYEPRVTVQQQNRCLDLLINLSFQGLNRLFVLSFEHNGGRTSYTRYYLPLLEKKDYNVVIDGRNFFDKPVKNSLITYNIRKIETGQGDDCTTGFLLDYNYFNNNYKTIAIRLSKQQALDTDPNAIQQINFTGNLARAAVATKFFIIEEAKKNCFRFFTRKCESIVNLFYLNIIST